jgi:DNA-binding NtrC family response regulator
MTIKIYHLDDEIQILERFERILSSGVTSGPVSLYSFEQPAKFEEAVRQSKNIDIFLLDVHLHLGANDGVRMAEICRELFPEAIIFMCSNATDLRTIRSSLLVGANDYISKDSSPEEIIARIDSALKDRTASDRLTSETTKIHAGSTLSLIKLRIPQIIKSAVNCVYILGESGTGKEVVADFLEAALPKGTPFIKLNCGSISQNLISSELFGHSKGSFTGAIAEKPGIIESANNGWIFLDEVATLPLDAQVSLLRAIDNQVIRRVGSTIERKVHFRIISATNESLSDLVEKGSFRRDLWQRLKETQIELSPLRERPYEIPELIEYFCSTMRGGPYQLAPNVSDILCNYSWKDGNIRELRNCLRAMTEKSIDGILTAKSIPENIWAGINFNEISDYSIDAYAAKKIVSSITLTWKPGCRPTYQDLSNRLLLEVIRHEFNVSGRLSIRAAAKAMGVPNSTMAQKLNNLIKSNYISSEDLRKLIKLTESD